MKKPMIERDLIIKITKQAQPRERAFFSIMRQTGLTPQAIEKLKISDLEEEWTIPRKIKIRQDFQIGAVKKPPYFIGEEANNYIKRYLATRQDLPPESLLFPNNNNPTKGISTQNVSRAFREALEKVVFGAGKRFSLLSLTRFYRENAKYYEKEVANHPNRDDEYYRDLYKKKAMPFVQIESSLTIMVTQHLTRKRFQNEIWRKELQIKEMKQTVARDSDYISSILTLLYNNNGNPETGENEEIGDEFIELWKVTREKQSKNLWDSVQSLGKIEFLPYFDIIEELTKTLERIKKPYDDLEQRIQK